MKLSKKVQRPCGFTLVELMVSMTVLAIMMMLIAQIIGQTQRSWRLASSRLSQFREARIAFDTITRNLRQATLNPYRDFHYASTGTNIPSSNQPEEAPDGYQRMSDLGFASGPAEKLVKYSGGGGGQLAGHAIFFQAPLGVTEPTSGYENLTNLLCARGYFVEYGDDSASLPKELASRLTPKSRYRLMEYQPPSERNQIYANAATWMNVESAYVRPVSDQIVAMILSPRLSAGEDNLMIGGVSQSPTSIASDYEYNSNTSKNSTSSNPQGTQYLLPPVVRVTMVALDEPTLELFEGEGPAKTNVLSAAGAKFTNAGSYQADLDKLKSYLSEKKMNYRIFEASVVIPSARWTL